MFHGEFGDGNEGQALPLTRLPLFYGVPEKDVLPAELWISRVESAARGANWNNVQTMAHVYGALRMKATAWLEHAQEARIPNIDHFENGFKEHFLTAFGKGKSNNAAVALFQGLSQKPEEGVTDYYLRISRAIKDLRQLMPQVEIPDEADVDELPDIPAAFAVAANAADAIAWYQAINIAAEHRIMGGIANQFCTAGLREEFREKVLLHKDLKEVQFYDLCEYLVKLELNQKKATLTGDKPCTAIAAVDAEHQYEVDAIRRFRGRGTGRGSRGRGSSRGGRGHPSASPSGARFDGKCHFCGKMGHRKADCFKLKAQMKTGKTHATEAVYEHVGDPYYNYGYNENAVGQSSYYQGDDQYAEANQAAVSFDYLN